MSLIDFKNKFNIDNHKRGNTVQENRFFRWSNNNFYRTSYNDMVSPVSFIIYIKLYARNL